MTHGRDHRRVRARYARERGLDQRPPSRSEAVTE